MRDITREEVLQQLQEREKEELSQLILLLRQIANERGFEIMAIPQISADGRLIAQWGLRRKS